MVMSKHSRANAKGYFRIRVGDYRVIFTIAPDEITIVQARHRSGIYR